MSFPRSQVVLFVGVLMLSGLMLPACTGGQTVVRDYGNPAETTKKDYYDDFMFGCTGVEAKPGTNTYSNPKLASQNYCDCVYKGMKAKVPFSDAKAFEEEQAAATENKDGTYDITIPKNIKTVMASCDGDR